MHMAVHIERKDDPNLCRQQCTFASMYIELTSKATFELRDVKIWLVTGVVWPYIELITLLWYG